MPQCKGRSDPGIADATFGGRHAAPATDSRRHAVPAAAPAAGDAACHRTLARSTMPLMLQTRILLAALLLLAGGRPAGAQGAAGGARLLHAGTGRRADAIEIDGPPVR